MVLISFIIVTNNRLDCLKRAVNSIREHSTGETEIIVVDNACTDGTGEWVAQQDDLIAVKSKANLGPGGGRNIGVRTARGKYVFFLDDDAFLRDDVVATVLDFFPEYEQVGCLAFPIWEVTLDKQLYGLRTGKSKCFAAGAACLEKNAFMQINGFDPAIRWSEEFDVSLRLWGAGYQVRTVDRPYVYHESYVSPSSPHSSSKIKEIVYGRLRAIMKSMSPRNGIVMGSRVVVLFFLQGLKTFVISPVPAALWRIFCDRHEIEKLRNPVPRDIEVFFMKPDELEDEFSIPIARKIWAKLKRGKMVEPGKQVSRE